jgi:protein-tyrosine-phosphatase
MAEAIARAEAARRGLEGVFCASAGVLAVAGQSAAAAAIAVAGERRIDLTRHRSRGIAPELGEWADVVLVMSSSHLAGAADALPDVETRLLTEHLPTSDPRRGLAVPDPFGGDRDTYEETYLLLERAIRGLLDDLFPAGAPPRTGHLHE